MQTYKIIIKDNSIPDHLQKILSDKGLLKTLEFTAIMQNEKIEGIEPYSVFFNSVRCYIDEMAQQLDTDPESLEILSIIKQ